MAGVNFDFIIAITLLNSESSVLTFGRSVQVGVVIAMIATARHVASSSRLKAAPRNDGSNPLPP